MTAKKILIVDDDQDLVFSFSIRLKANGYSVVSAADGFSAISVATEEAPDLIILDLGLPRADGFVVLERIKNLAGLAEVPVIVLSARDPARNRQRSLEAEAVAFFQKPPDNSEFLSAIRQALGETVVLSTLLRTRVSGENIANH